MSLLHLAGVDVRGKKVLIRADLNVPQNEAGQITDDTRIRASLPCIRDALARGAAVMVTSHLGRPTEGQFSAEDSLAPVAERIAALLELPIPLVRDWVDGGEWHARLAPGQAVLLENCRFNRGEKENDDGLARRIAALCDVYVNDAFGTAHRAEATTHGVALHAPVACAGPLMAAEVEALGRALANPRRPLVAIVGGAKVSTKLMLLQALAEKVDTLIVGGGIANTFIAATGRPIGKSLAEREMVGEVKAILDRFPGKVPMPTDAWVARRVAADAVATLKSLEAVDEDDLILDAGPRTLAPLASIIAQAGTIVWNGPIGVFELEPFASGTKALAEAIAASPAFSIAGGGDTVAAINKFGVADRISYISTAGGAFLEFLEGRTLPAIAALESRSH